MRSPVFIATVLFSLILLVVVQSIVFFDKHRDLVENFIADSSVISESVGAVQSTKLTKITSVGIDISNEKSYKKYYFQVKGTKARARLAIVLTQKNGEYRINIQSIEKYERW